MVLIPVEMRVRNHLVHNRLLTREDIDVFGLRIAPSSQQGMTEEMLSLQKRIHAVKKRLRSLSLNEAAWPSQSSASASHLPTIEYANARRARLSSITKEISRLPQSVDNASINAEISALKHEADVSANAMERILKLAAFNDCIQKCDAACSDLLEHVDSYPDDPPGPLLSTHISDPSFSPEEQLGARLNFTKSMIEPLSTTFVEMTDDFRASAEEHRIVQTYAELEDMALDRIRDQKSRPVSVTSSGRSSRVSLAPSTSSFKTPSKAHKARGYSALSRRPAGPSKAPGPITPRRSKSGSSQPPIPPPKRVLATPSNRSISGPLSTTPSRLFSSTYASRQRTASLAPIDDTPPRQATTPSRPAPVPGRGRAASPTPSDASSLSRSTKNTSRSSNTSTSTWARAPPRKSFLDLPKEPPPEPRQAKKTYIANPKNKLDVAVGDVVNNLPVNINVELVADTWKDQSGKYWIGDQDPKLCFCRILRSQMVMVRVGGGWTELSRYVK